MQNKFGTSWSRIEFLCIFLAVIAPKGIVSLSSNVVIDDYFEIVRVSELVERDIVERDVITYQQQQQQQTREQHGSAKDIRTLEIKSKGFKEKASDSQPTYLFATPFKDSCRKNASFLPSWKIDNGTSNGVFRLEINYEQRLAENDFFLCVFDGDGQHLGDASRFRLKR